MHSNSVKDLRFSGLDDDDDDAYSDVVPAEGRPMRASLSSCIVYGNPFEEEKPCNPVSGRGPFGS